MPRLNVSPVVLSAASSAAVVISFAIARIVSPELTFDRLLTSKWIGLFGVELASAIPLFFLKMKVRGARWLWLVWLISAADYSKVEFVVVWRSYHTWLVTGVCLAWAVKVVVLIMLFSSPGIRWLKQKKPDNTLERTPGSVTSRADGFPDRVSLAKAQLAPATAPSPLFDG
jgi:hypothetical protein